MDAAPRVLAIVVVHDGAHWLDASLQALRDQTYDALEVVVVDNGSSDGSRDILLRHFDPDDLLVAERDLGFGAAVSMALDAAPPDIDYLLFVHDDLALDPDTVTRLVHHLEEDPSLAIVGPKLVDWADPGRLGEVGMGIDITGRADSGVDPDEIDQGQRDQIRPVLYVSSAGMLVRRDVFDQLGRFDRRYHLFREDLDLCWRAWLAGHRVEVLPHGTARHAAAAANYQRLGQTAFIGPRYFAERNTLSTLLKNYSAPRLVYLLPLFLVVGIAKIVGFVATRRVSDAWQTVRAWAWNIRDLRATLRQRRAVQGLRVRTDGELRPLFERTAPRVRAYAEAVGDWIAGGGEPAVLDEEVAEEPPTATRRAVEFVRSHPLSVGASILMVVGVVVALPLLGSGQLRGGELAPWPSSARAFLTAYVSAWHDSGGFGTSTSSSPAQALLGAFGYLTLGSAWLAQRALLLLPIPLAWLLTLRAGLVVTDRRVPRLAAATAYALSPPAIAAVTTAEVGGLVALVALPALVIAGTAIVAPSASPARAWRGTAAAALVLAATVAFEPPFAIIAGVVLVIALAGVRVAAFEPGERGIVTVRLLAVPLATFLLLFPWSIELFRADSPVLGGFRDVTAPAEPFWRWLVLTPEAAGFPGVAAGVAFVAAGVLGVALGLRRRPVAVPALWGLVLVGVATAWLTGRSTGPTWVWVGIPLLLAAAAYAGLLALAFASAGEALTQHAFGWRQLASAITVIVVIVGIGGSLLHLLRDPWGEIARAAPILPAFIETETAEVGPFRTVVLADRNGRWEWDITGANGPLMTQFGVPPARALVALVSDALERTASATDPGAAAGLALANVRYVVVPEGGTSEAVSEAFEEQFAIEPVPVSAGEVYRVTEWLPRVAFVPTAVADSLSRRGELPLGTDPVPFVPLGATRYVGDAPTSGEVLVSEAAAGGWTARADGAALPLRVQSGLVRFGVPVRADVITVEYARQSSRTALVLIELLVFLLVVSLMLRPPRFATGEGRR
ncbi:MAG: glycosyltransferase family 2 protein [Actinobacteria bacterium]|nr:glycosyltransferase family 2 protein [Actinomycetota bacterium]